MATKHTLLCLIFSLMLLATHADWVGRPTVESPSSSFPAKLTLAGIIIFSATFSLTHATWGKPCSTGNGRENSLDDVYDCLV